MRIAAYCRVSTEHNEQLESLNNQKTFFEEYAKKEGHELKKIYADEGITGTSIRHRTAFLELLEDAQNHEFDMVVVKDISRFARNTVDLLQSIRKLKALGINTYFINTNMESMGESEFILTIYAALAQQESYNLSKRIKFGKNISAKKGRVPQIIFGYDRIDNYTLKINESEANTVRLIFELYTKECLGCHSISLKLNSLGHKTKHMCQWNPRAVRRILCNSIYCGEYVNNKYEVSDCIEKKLKRQPAENEYHHKRPEWAIISPEVYYKAQSIMSSRSKNKTDNSYKKERYSNKNLFSTLIKCENCNRSFTRKIYRGKNERIYWKCPTNDQLSSKVCDNNVKIDEKELILKISDFFKSYIEDKSIFDELTQEIEQKNLDVNDNTDYFCKEILLIERRLLKYQNMYFNDLIAIDELKEKMNELQEKRKYFEHKLEATNKKKEDKPIMEYENKINKILNLDGLTNSDLRSIIEIITVDKEGNVKIHINCNLFRVDG